MTPDRFVHYTVNVPGIDADHYNLLTQMDRIIKSAKVLPIPEIRAALEVLKHDLAKHFSREESYMAAINFPYIDAHIQSHIAMTTTINQSISGMVRDDRVSEFYIKHLEELLLTHIDSQDMQYAQWVVKHKESKDTKY